MTDFITMFVFSFALGVPIAVLLAYAECVGQDARKKADELNDELFKKALWCARRKPKGDQND
jgi:hypothetical protein